MLHENPVCLLLPLRGPHVNIYRQNTKPSRCLTSNSKMSGVTFHEMGRSRNFLGCGGMHTCNSHGILGPSDLELPRYDLSGLPYRYRKNGHILTTQALVTIQSLHGHPYSMYGFLAKIIPFFRKSCILNIHDSLKHGIKIMNEIMESKLKYNKFCYTFISPSQCSGR